MSNYPAPAVYSTLLGPHSWTWNTLDWVFLLRLFLLLAGEPYSIYLFTFNHRHTGLSLNSSLNVFYFAQQRLPLTGARRESSHAHVVEVGVDGRPGLPRAQLGLAHLFITDFPESRRHQGSTVGLKVVEVQMRGPRPDAYTPEKWPQAWALSC